MSTFKGPHLPPHLQKERNTDNEESEDDYGPSLLPQEFQELQSDIDHAETLNSIKNRSNAINEVRLESKRPEWMIEPPRLKSATASGLQMQSKTFSRKTAQIDVDSSEWTSLPSSTSNPPIKKSIKSHEISDADLKMLSTIKKHNVILGYSLSFFHTS